MGTAVTQRDAPFNEAPRPPFAAFVEDEATRRLVAKLADARGWPPEAVRGGAVNEAVLALDGVPTPEVLVIDLSSAASPLAEANRLADVCDPGTVVIGLGAVNDVNLFRQLMGMGLADYLLKPIAPEVLNEAIDAALYEPEPEPEPADRAKVLLVTGSRGGCGASTVAANIAWLIAHEHHARTALVDLDLQFGTSALTLDLEPGRGFREALENPARVDSLFMERAMVKQSDTLSLLCAEEALDKPLAPKAEALEMILQHVGADREWIVLDAPRRMLADTPAVLSQATAVALVSDLTLAGMRDTLRMRAFIRGMAPAASLHLVGSRLGMLKKGELDRATFEKGAEATLDAALPFDAAAAATGLEKGQPICAVAKGSKTTAALKALTDDICGDRVKPAGLLTRLLHIKS